MIIETITVTTVPTSIFDLLAVAGRDIPAESKVSKCLSLSFRLPVASSDVVLCSDVGTVTPVILLDPTNGQPYESHLDANLHQTLLSVGSGTSVVGVIISQ